MFCRSFMDTRPPVSDILRADATGIAHVRSLILTASDFMPLRDDLAAMDGAIDAVERGHPGSSPGRGTQGTFFHRAPGADGNNSFRLSIAAGTASRPVCASLVTRQIHARTCSSMARPFNRWR